MNNPYLNPSLNNTDSTRGYLCSARPCTQPLSWCHGLDMSRPHLRTDHRHQRTPQQVRFTPHLCKGRQPLYQPLLPTPTPFLPASQTLAKKAALMSPPPHGWRCDRLFRRRTRSVLGGPLDPVEPRGITPHGFHSSRLIDEKQPAPQKAQSTKLPRRPLTFRRLRKPCLRRVALPAPDAVTLVFPDPPTSPETRFPLPCIYRGGEVGTRVYLVTGVLGPHHPRGVDQHDRRT